MNLINIDILHIRGKAYIFFDDYEKAIGDYNRVIQLHPDFVIAICNLGYCHDKVEEHDKAIEYYNRAIRINPEFCSCI
jgi:tetratricopeptide (TPR) repeat protein